MKKRKLANNMEQMYWWHDLLWDSNKTEVDHFTKHGNKFHAIIKFTAEISENEITFPEAVVFKGERLKNKYILDDYWSS